MPVRLDRGCIYLALLLSQSLVAPAVADKVTGPTLQESIPEVRADITRCQPVILTATAALSLKSPSPSRLAHLTEGATLEVPAGGPSARIVILQARPAMVHSRYGSKDKVGAQVECRVELLAPSDSPARSYSVMVRLSRAHDLSYWGADLYPYRFVFAGKLQPARSGQVCPRSSLPSPAASPPAPTHLPNIPCFRFQHRNTARKKRNAMPMVNKKPMRPVSVRIST